MHDAIYVSENWSRHELELVDLFLVPPIRSYVFVYNCLATYPHVTVFAVQYRP